MMKYKSYSVYDDVEFFEKYTKKRDRLDSPNEVIEQPIIDQLIGDVKDKRVLDLGCGDGKYGVQLLKRGAKLYDGIEGSHRMANLAKENLKAYNSRVEENDIEKVEFKEAAYDIVISRLVLHYVEDIGSLLKKIRLSLKEEGEFIFSVEHPIITSCYEAYHQEVKRGSWIVDDYFKSGERVNTWLGKDVVKHHKTLEQYWQIIKEANFDVVEIRESKPEESHFKSKEEYQRRLRIPLFLMFKIKRRKDT